MANRTTTMIAIGTNGRNAAAPAPAPIKVTTRISSVAYAVDEIASDANTGNAIFFERRWWASSSLEMGLPMRSFLSEVIEHRYAVFLTVPLLNTVH
jgi:hypothetical protein